MKDALAKSEQFAVVLGHKTESVPQVKYLFEQSCVQHYQLKTASIMYDAAKSPQAAPTFIPEEPKISDKVLVTFTFTP